ncbi:prephenate dehydratase [Planktotalea sp.]|uniref:prephenate dehydratase n=1 Tax=Planktotalea sp. TaxID=2029877 RepID=UPI0025CBF824|nr:prephenate dehydratase [Planktotalea sp.]
MTKKIAFQGELGAYSHEACAQNYPNMEPLPCRTFEDVINAVNSKDAEFAMLPVENSTYGRVADSHRLLPSSDLHIVGEAFTRVRISLMAMPGTALSNIKKVRAHTVLLPQAAAFLNKHNIHPESAVDSAGAAAELVKNSDMNSGVLASEFAAQIYGLNVLAKNIEDHGHNTTRFLVMSRDCDLSKRGDTGMLTSFIFRVRNLPAALYKAMGGFATNGVNMTKLESYMVDGHFTATQFYADIEGHPEDENVKRALDELSYFTSEITILGTYPRAPERACATD